MPKTAQKDASVATVKKQGAVMKHIKKYWQWYAMMFIPIVYYIVFRYIPMFGNIIAFRRYRAGSSIFGDEWSGLKYFNQFMKDQNFWRAFKNTLLLNFKYLIISFPLTLIAALLPPTPLLRTSRTSAMSTASTSTLTSLSPTRCSSTTTPPIP